MEDLSLHILDIVENSVRAEASRVIISIRISTPEHSLEVEIVDDGRGMDEDQARTCQDPFFTTKANKKIGLGISLFKQSALEAGGSFSLTSSPGKGTRVSATFQLDHIDRRPLGEIGKTLYLLIASFPRVDFVFSYSKDGTSFELSTREIKDDLGDIPISSPDVLKTLRTMIESGIESVGKV